MDGQNKDIINYTQHLWETSLRKPTPGYQISQDPRTRWLQGTGSEDRL